MIILTSSAADQVRGPTSHDAALVPRKLKSGFYALPEAVLDDPNHAVHHSFLSTLPKRDVVADEWPDEVIL